MRDDLRPEWARKPLRPGEYDVPVVFRITAESEDAARQAMAVLVAGGSVLDRHERQYLVPMFVDGSAGE